MLGEVERQQPASIGKSREMTADCRQSGRQDGK